MNLCFPTSALYVGDLHPDVTEAILYEKFSSAGPLVSLRVCRDAISRKSLGYAYVNFQQPADAERALDTMNFDLVKNKPIRIMWSQRDPSLRKSGIGNLFIKNLDKNIDNKSMYDTFSAFGNILSCKVMLDDNGCSRGYGFIHFETEDAAKNAIEKVNGMLLNGKKVYVGRFIPHKIRIKTLGDRPRIFTNIYVKNMKDMSEDKLVSLFSKYGKITSCAVMKNTDGSSKGYGFVAFEENSSAERAVLELHEKEISDMKLYVGRAQKKIERQIELKRQYEDVKTERYNRLHGVNLFLKNLEDNIDDERLKKEFQSFGTITSAKVMQEDGRSKGFGFVCFSSQEEATKALIEMHGKMLGTKPLYVALAQRKDERKAYLSSHLQRTRIQPTMFPAAAPFLIPAVAQAPRFYNHMNHIRSNPRWVASSLRPNGTYAPINNIFRVNSRQSIPPNQVRNNTPLLPPRPITGAQQAAIHTRPNSKYTSNNHILRQSAILCNGGDNFPLNPTTLASASPEDQKQILGQRLFPHVEKLYPELAGKITGMLLEIDTSELIHMIEDQESLKAKIEEAIAVLQAHQGSSNISHQSKKVVVIQE